MKLFNKKTIIKAPVSGTVMDLKDVNDPVFSQGMMGPGFAIKNHNGEVFSPIEGIVESIFPTKHAITVGTKSGKQVLLHLGIDTVELKGEPFDVLVKEGQSINTGDKLVVMDLDMINDNQKDSVVMVLLPDEKPGSLLHENALVNVGDDVYKFAN